MSEKEIEYPRHWWFSCNNFTCYVQSDSDNNVTRQSAPIVRRFTGQPIKNLVGWMKKRHGGFLYREYNTEKRIVGRS